MEWWEQGGSGLPPGWGAPQDTGSGQEGGFNFVQNPNQAVTNTPAQDWQFTAGGDQGAGGWSRGGQPVEQAPGQTLPETYGKYLATGGAGAYDFSRYNRDVSGVPTLEGNAFENWQNNDFLSRMIGTAGKGAIYTGLGALLSGTQDLGAVTGFAGNTANPNNIDDNTYKQLAQYMGINTADPSWKQQVLDQSNNYAMVKGMIGGDTPRDSKQILYQKGQDGRWNPILNYDWHEREKGSWWSEGGKMIMVPLSIAAGGALSTLGQAGNAAAAGGGITGTGGALGTAAYGGAGLGSTLGTAGTGSLGAGLAGAAGTGSTIATGAGVAGGLGGTLANAVGLGQEYAALPGYAQQGISGALQGAGQSALQGQNPLEGALTGGLMGAVNPAISGAIKDLGLGQTLTGALSGAARGGLSGLLGGGNPLTGALLGGLGGTTSGGLSQLGASSGLANTAGQLVSRVGGNYLQEQIRDEVFQGRQDLMRDIYSEAERRGISRQQLEMFLRTPQGRQAAQQLLSQQGKGTLQSLFG